MSRIILATGNNHKIEEIAHLARRNGCTAAIVGAVALGGMPHVEETAGSFDGNARLKAEALLALAGPEDWVLADDSGLEVDALGGAPGVYSARYAGAYATDRENLEHLLQKLGNTPEARRTARFRCVLVLLGPGGQAFTAEGAVEGSIRTAPSGGFGFGYDPIFQPDGYAKTFAELGAEGKHRLSHRARAFAALLAQTSGLL